MTSRYLKRFAILFTFILLIQECDPRKLTRHEKAKYHDVLQDLIDLEYDNDVTKLLSDIKSDTKKVNKFHENSVVTKKENSLHEKRWVGATLLAIGGISAGFDIYKQESGCKLSHPDLYTNLEKLDTLNEQAKQMRDAINLRWNDVVDAEGYMTRLDSVFLVISEQISTLDAVQLDILQLLDQNVISKIDLQKRYIENAIINVNDTTLHDPKELEKQFFTPLQYGLTLSLKLTPIALWIGSKTFFPDIANAVSKRMARAWASENPGLLNRMFRNIKDVKILPETRQKFSNWKKTSPTLKSIREKMTFSDKTKARLKTAKSVLTNLGKVGIVGLFLFYEGWMTYKFFKKCDDDLKKSEEWLDEVNDSIKNMTEINGNITSLLGDIASNYTLMWNNLTTDELHSFVTEVKETALNAQYQTDTLEAAAQNAQKFLDSIKSTKKSDGTFDEAEVESLTNTLVSALTATTIKLDCYRKKVQIIASITTDCAIGLGSYATLWQKAKDLAGAISECKIEGKEYLSQEEVKNITIEYMRLQGKNDVCVRNDGTVGQLVCNAWLKKETNDQILTSVNQDIANSGKVLTADDVVYFVDKCTPASVGDDEKKAICYLKTEGKTSDEVLQEYSRHVESEVKSAYNGCELSDDQKTVLCGYKKSGYDVAYCQGKYPLYSAAIIETAYKSCVFEITPADKYVICLKVKYESKGDIDHDVHKEDLANFGRENLQKTINECLDEQGDEKQKRTLNNAITKILKNDDNLREYLSNHITEFNQKRKVVRMKTDEEKRREKICAIVGAMKTTNPLDHVFTKDRNEIGLRDLTRVIHHCKKSKRMYKK